MLFVLKMNVIWWEVINVDQLCVMWVQHAESKNQGEPLSSKAIGGHKKMHYQNVWEPSWLDPWYHCWRGLKGESMLRRLVRETNKRCMTQSLRSSYNGFWSLRAMPKIPNNVSWMFVKVTIIVIRWEHALSRGFSW